MYLRRSSIDEMPTLWMISLLLWPVKTSQTNVRDDNDNHDVDDDHASNSNNDHHNTYHYASHDSDDNDNDNDSNGNINACLGRDQTQH